MILSCDPPKNNPRSACIRVLGWCELLGHWAHDEKYPPSGPADKPGPPLLAAASGRRRHPGRGRERIRHLPNLPHQEDDQNCAGPCLEMMSAAAATRLATCVLCSLPHITLVKGPKCATVPLNLNCRKTRAENCCFSFPPFVLITLLPQTIQ